MKRTCLDNWQGEDCQGYQEAARSFKEYQAELEDSIPQGCKTTRRCPYGWICLSIHQTGSCVCTEASPEPNAEKFNLCETKMLKIPTYPIEVKFGNCVNYLNGRKIFF